MFLDDEAPLFSSKKTTNPHVQPHRLFVFDVMKNGIQVDLKKYKDYEEAQHQWIVMQNFGYNVSPIRQVIL